MQIKVTIGDKPCELTVEDARKLYEELAQLFGEAKPVEYVPYWPYTPRPWEPYKITWTADNYAACQSSEQPPTFMNPGPGRYKKYQHTWDGTGNGKQHELQPTFNSSRAGSIPAGDSVCP